LFPVNPPTNLNRRRPARAASTSAGIRGSRKGVPVTKERSEDVKRAPAKSASSGAGLERVRVVRTAIAGVLMGLANLVPGVSGGTMVLVMGLYDQFVSSLADATRLRFTRRSVLFLVLLAFTAGAAIALFSGPMSLAVTNHRSAMFCLFIGLTLGGTPVLAAMLKPVRWPAGVGLLVGLGAMIAIGQPQEPELAEGQDGEVAVVVALEPDYPRDVAAGVLGMSAMVLPGISGAHMLLILGRYEVVLAAVSQTKDYVFSLGGEGSLSEFLPIMIPVAIGALVGLVVLSNLLKWMLRRHKQAMVGALLGVLWGAVYALWPFSAASGAGDYLLGVGLMITGFAATAALSRISA